MTMIQQRATIGTAFLTISDEDFVQGYHEGYTTYQNYHSQEDAVDTATLLFLIKNGWDAGHSDQWNTGYITGWLAAFYEQEQGQLVLRIHEQYVCCQPE